MGENPDDKDAGQETDADDSEEEIEVPDDFDPQRALATIKAQRESERALKNDLKTLRAQVKTLEKEQTSKDDADKSADEKLIALESKNESLLELLAQFHVAADFKAKATEKGLDPELGWYVAQAEGFAGEYDAVKNTVGEHDFDGLLKRFPNLRVESDEDEDEDESLGDASPRRRHTGQTPAEMFNTAIRAKLRGM